MRLTWQDKLQRIADLRSEPELSSGADYELAVPPVDVHDVERLLFRVNKQALRALVAADRTDEFGPLLMQTLTFSNGSLLPLSVVAVIAATLPNGLPLEAASEVSFLSREFSTTGTQMYSIIEGMVRVVGAPSVVLTVVIEPTLEQMRSNEVKIPANDLEIVDRVVKLLSIVDNTPDGRPIQEIGGYE